MALRDARRRTGVCASALLAMSALVACTQQSTAPPAPGLATAPAGDVGGDSAELAGTLQDGGGCLYVTTPGGDSIIPVFPDDGAQWDGTVLTVTVPSPGSSALTVRVGDELTGLGGGSADTAPPGADIPTACPSGFGFFRVGNWMSDE